MVFMWVSWIFLKYSFTSKWSRTRLGLTYSWVLPLLPFCPSWSPSGLCPPCLSPISTLSSEFPSAPWWLWFSERGQPMWVRTHKFTSPLLSRPLFLNRTFRSRPKQSRCGYLSKFLESIAFDRHIPTPKPYFLPRLWFGFQSSTFSLSLLFPPAVVLDIAVAYWEGFWWHWLNHRAFIYFLTKCLGRDLHQLTAWKCGRPLEPMSRTIFPWLRISFMQCWQPYLIIVWN